MKVERVEVKPVQRDVQITMSIEEAQMLRCLIGFGVCGGGFYEGPFNPMYELYNQLERVVPMTLPKELGVSFSMPLKISMQKDNEPNGDYSSYAFDEEGF